MHTPKPAVQHMDQLERLRLLESLYRALTDTQQTPLPDHQSRASAWRQLGDDFLSCEKTDRALTCYKHAFALTPDESLILKIAQIYERLNRVQEGREAIAQLAAGTSARAAYTLARYEYRSDDNAAAARRLEKLLGDPGLGTRATIRTLYLLGQVYEHCGRNREAFRAAEEANRLAKTEVDRESPQLGQDAAVWLEAIRDSREWYTEERLARLSAAGKPQTSRDLFIVGFPRSGTTLLDQVLDANPALAVAEETDALPHTFSAYLHDATAKPLMWAADDEEASKLCSSYRSRLAAHTGRDANMMVDKLPLNLLYLDVIRRFFPSAKVMVMLRDPRDALLSNFYQSYRLNHAMYHFLGLRQGALFYAETMEFYLRVGRRLGLDIMEIRYEDLIADLPTVSRRVTDFLGVPWNAAMLDFARHATTREIRTPSYRQVSQPLYGTSAGRWLRNATEIASVLPIIEPYVAAFGYEASAKQLVGTEADNRGSGDA